MGSHVHGKSRPSTATCSRFAPACKCTHAQSTKEIGTEEGKHRNALKTFTKAIIFTLSKYNEYILEFKNDLDSSHYYDQFSHKKFRKRLIDLKDN